MLVLSFLGAFSVFYFSPADYFYGRRKNRSRSKLVQPTICWNVEPAKSPNPTKFLSKLPIAHLEDREHFLTFPRGKACGSVEKSCFEFVYDNNSWPQARFWDIFVSLSWSCLVPVYQVRIFHAQSHFSSIRSYLALRSQSSFPVPSSLFLWYTRDNFFGPFLSDSFPPQIFSITCEFCTKIHTEEPFLSRYVNFDSPWK